MHQLTYLLDGNVLIALALENHIHRGRCLSWFPNNLALSITTLWFITVTDDRQVTTSSQLMIANEASK